MCSTHVQNQKSLEYYLFVIVLQLTDYTSFQKYCDVCNLTIIFSTSFRTNQRTLHPNMGHPLLLRLRIPLCHGLNLEICRHHIQRKVEGINMGHAPVTCLRNSGMYLSFLLQSIEFTVFGRIASLLHVIGECHLCYCRL